MNIRISERIRLAQSRGRPVVALETTVVTHGMAWPDNLEVALAMESGVREQGAEPATLGIIDGTLVIGMDEREIETFARAEDGSIAKSSRRDLPVIIGLGRRGSLTVAGTIWAAHRAGIRMVATGGIGGVHRGHPEDVSADLTELGRTPVTVVCAGAKSILDLPRTLEVLETQGVPVVGLGTGELPAFYSRESGLELAHHVADVTEAAAVFRAWLELASSSGLLFAVPPPEDTALPGQEIESLIERAVLEADEAGIRGSAVTPFLLGRIVDLTGGRSLAANKGLLVNNAATAARIAVAAGLESPSRG